jgi:hypothetical protein
VTTWAGGDQGRGLHQQLEELLAALLHENLPLFTSGMLPSGIFLISNIVLRYNTILTRIG